jgi:hypothetical protein
LQQSSGSFHGEIPAKNCVIWQVVQFLASLC